MKFEFPAVYTRTQVTRIYPRSSLYSTIYRKYFIVKNNFLKTRKNTLFSCKVCSCNLIKIQIWDALCKMINETVGRARKVVKRALTWLSRQSSRVFTHICCK